MASIVTGLLTSTVGVLWHKARITAAAKLQNGDVTDARIRQIIVPPLTDLSTKLNDLLRQELNSSYILLNEGANLLNDCIANSDLEHHAVRSKIQHSHDENSKLLGGFDSEILNEALQFSYVMEKLTESSHETLERAKKRFEQARLAATKAFGLETLSIEEKLFVAKLRVASELLECLASPSGAVPGCLSFLEMLHRLPAIQNIFNVHLDGGIKSKIYRAEREENVKSVMLINHALFQYALKFSSKHSSTVLTWPTIELRDHLFCPILRWQEIAEKISSGNELTHQPNGLLLVDAIDSPKSAVNIHGEIFVEDRLSFNNIKVISRAGESKSVKLPGLKEDEVLVKDIKAIACGNHNDVYVVRWLRKLTKNGAFVKSYVLNVFDMNFNVKCDRKLDFIDAETEHHATMIAVNVNDNIILIKYKDPYVYICDKSGMLKHLFERDSSPICLPSNLSISAANAEFMILSALGKTISMYTEEGNLKSTFKIPPGHEVLGMAFHYVICKTIVLTMKKVSYFLLQYSTAGELETKFLCNRNENEWRPSITSHPSGPIAIVRERNIIFI